MQQDLRSHARSYAKSISRVVEEATPNSTKILKLGSTSRTSRTQNPTKYFRPRAALIGHLPFQAFATFAGGRRAKRRHGNRSRVVRLGGQVTVIG
jgi:hypothetical protein